MLIAHDCRRLQRRQRVDFWDRESGRASSYQEVEDGPRWSVHLQENINMSENEKSNEQPGFLDSILKDDGVHRAAAGVVVAVVVATAKHVIFGRAS